MVKKTLTINVLALLFLIGYQAPAWAQGSSGITSFGGESRGITKVKGRILCTTCSLKEASAANPDLQSKLYEFTNGAQRAVFQLVGLNEVGGRQDLNEVARWQAIVGLRKQLPVRMREALWKQLVAEENLRREVELTSLLRSTGVLDVGELTFLTAE